MKNTENKLDFQKEWEMFQNHIQDFKLVKIKEIYLPFWSCKQNVVVEKEIELDRFSKIILELVSIKITKHKDICNFLGIEKNSFVTIQFHFLIKNYFLIENNFGEYEITHEGLEFLKNKTNSKSTEKYEFEYFMKEKFDYLRNDLTQNYFDPFKPIDKQLSDTKKNEFSGYIVLQTNKLEKNNDTVNLIHNDKNKPTFRRIAENRSEFSDYFNNMFYDKYFYDFADNELETHKRSILFLFLLYENEQNEFKIEIRHSAKTVRRFKSNELEKELSVKVQEIYKESPSLFNL